MTADAETLMIATEHSQYRGTEDNLKCGHFKKGRVEVERGRKSKADGWKMERKERNTERIERG